MHFSSPFIAGLVLLLLSNITHSSTRHFHFHKRHPIPPQQYHGPRSAARLHQERNHPRSMPLDPVHTMTVVAPVTATITVPPPSYPQSTSSSTTSSSSSSAFNHGQQTMSPSTSAKRLRQIRSLSARSEMTLMWTLSC